MPDTYSIKPQIYNISHANTNIDFVTKKRYFLWHTTYTPQSRSPQIYKHLEAAGFRWSPAASFVLCLLIRRATPQHNIQALLDVLPSTCTVFVEVIFEGDAAVPELDFLYGIKWNSIPTSSLPFAKNVVTLQPLIYNKVEEHSHQ